MPNIVNQKVHPPNGEAEGSKTVDAQSHLQSASCQPIKRRPGRPPVPNPKQAVSLRLEPEVLEKFRATGPGWQRLMNDVLKAAKL
jgi:uncharacterized protein (DUF4415 family)